MPSNVSVLVTWGPIRARLPGRHAHRHCAGCSHQHFRLEYEAATTYQMTVDEVRVPELATIGQVAGDASSAALKLVRS